MNEGSVNLTIGKEIVNPIVEAKIKDAIIQALGGSEDLIKKVVDQVLNQKVNYDGKTSSYSSDNKFSWMDVVVTQQIKLAIEKELTVVIAESADSIKESLLAQIKSKAGSELVANALLSGLTKTFESAWTSKVDLIISPNKN